MSREPARLGELEHELAGGIRSAGRSWSIFYFDEVASTMDVARDLWERGDTKGPALVATRSQSAGRGRRGREWLQTEGALYATYVFETDLPVERLAAFSLVMGVAIVKELESLGCELRLKWPNDIMSADVRKIGGILIEVAGDDRRRALLCGCGINLLNSPRSLPAAAALTDCVSKELSSLAAAQLISAPLFSAFQTFERDGFAAYKQQWLNKAMCLGKPVRLENDVRHVDGIFRGLGANGEIQIEVGGRVLEYSSGDLSLRSSA
ncbi:MAG: biotin--[acetyl-CoA-carboxylase] ligase [Deltaproteobacteria bacterium]|nr:biotin--[acetyl-CoA-carboxylase] ligase [Deltaproteobacteria bacterium]